MPAQCETGRNTEMKDLLIVDLYSDGECLRVFEDTPEVRTAIEEWRTLDLASIEASTDGPRFEDYLIEKGFESFCTARIGIGLNGLLLSLADRRRLTLPAQHNGQRLLVFRIADRLTDLFHDPLGKGDLQHFPVVVVFRGELQEHIPINQPG